MGHALSGLGVGAGIAVDRRASGPRISGCLSDRTRNHIEAFALGKKALCKDNASQSGIWQLGELGHAAVQIALHTRFSANHAGLATLVPARRH